MPRRVLLLAALIVTAAGAAAAAATQAACERATLPEPVPVLELEGARFTLVGPPEPFGEILPGAPDNHPCSQGKIRPGMRAVFNDAYLCSLNWIYKDAAGALYVGTAGHCAANYNPRKITVAGVASDIGDVAFTTGHSGVGNDFALIRIDPSLYGFVDPTLCHWGGPQAVGQTGLLDETLLHYGWGVDFNINSITRARAGATMSWGTNSITFLGSGGDSGSPLMLYDPVTGQGRAAGVITHTSYLQPPHLGPQYANTVTGGLARANAAQPGMNYQVVMSAVAPDLTGLSVP